jgi:hypothetical protein
MREAEHKQPKAGITSKELKASAGIAVADDYQVKFTTLNSRAPIGPEANYVGVAVVCLLCPYHQTPSTHGSDSPPPWARCCPSSSGTDATSRSRRRRSNRLKQRCSAIHTATRPRHIVLHALLAGACQQHAGYSASAVAAHSRAALASRHSWV